MQIGQVGYHSEIKKTYPTKELGRLEERYKSSKPLKKSCLSLSLLFPLFVLFYIVITLLHASLSSLVYELLILEN